MNPEDTQSQETEMEEPLILVTELSEFIPMLEDWHRLQVATVQHMQTIPEGQRIIAPYGVAFVGNGFVGREIGEK